jgi:hypothetical protein
MNIRSIIFSKVNIASLSALTGLHTFSGVIASIDAFCANITHIASIAVVTTVVVYNVLKIIYLRKEKP